MPSAFRIFEVVLYALVSFLPYVLIALYPFKTHLRFSRRNTAALLLLLTLVQIGFSVWASLFTPENSGLLSLLSTVCYAAFYFITVKAHPGKLLSMLLMVSNLTNLIVVSAKCLEGFCLPQLSLQHYRWSFSVATVLMQCLLLPPYFLFFNKFIRKNVVLRRADSLWRYLWMIPATFYLFWYYNSYFSGLSSLELALRPMTTVFNLLVNLGALLIYYIIAREMREFDENIRLREQNHQLSLQALQYESLKERMDETRRARHDMRHHMTVLQSFLENGEYARLNDYVNRFLKTSPSSQPICYCEHFALNAVISYYAQLAIERGIAFSSDIAVPQEIAMTDADLTVLFGNLLENACDACMGVPKERRLIRLHGGLPNKGALVFTLDNSFNGIVKQENGRFLSSKHDGFGIGMESAQNVAERYRGELRIEPADGMFQVSAVLHL